MNTKALARSTAALIVIIIVVVAAFGGYVLVSQRGPTPSTSVTTSMATVPQPSFVASSTYVAEDANKFQWLDPAVAYYEYDWEMIMNQYDTLLWYNGASGTDIIPWLAQNYTMVSPNQYQFKLRQGITFQDGTPFNARAVWFSFNRLLVMDATSGTGNHGTQAAWMIEQLIDTTPTTFTFFGASPKYDSAWVQSVLAFNFVQVVDDYTVNINVKNPTTAFPYLLAAEFAAIVSPSFVVSHDFPSACKTSDCPADSIDYNAYFNHIAGHGDVSMNYLNLPTKGSKAGTGPYYIDSVNPTTYEIVMKANPTWWGGAKNWNGPPLSASIKTLDFVYVPDFATRLLDLKAGKATAIGVSHADMYSVVDKDQWLTQGKLVPTIPGVTVYGPYTELVTDWFNFLTNVTDTTGTLRTFQPFADLRWRTAVASSVNMTDANININNRLGIVPTQLIPPGTGPEGAYDPSLQLAYSYNLTTMASLIQDACKNPLTSFVDVNGHPIAAGKVNNSCDPKNPQSIQMYVGTGDTLDERILTTMADNLNGVSTPLGVTFTIVPVPGGQYYTLAAEHVIYLYWGGWVNDYNHVIDWLGPMYNAAGSYPAWNNMNYTTLNQLYTQAVQDDMKGDVSGLVSVTKQMNIFSNNAVEYVYIDNPEAFATRSSWLHGFYWNQVLDVMWYYAAYSYSAPT